MKYAIFGNTYQRNCTEEIKQVFDILRKRHDDVLVEGVFMRYLQRELSFTPDNAYVFDANDYEADMAISLGGDGTFIESARRIGRKPIPILGINIGRMGFMADVEKKDIDAAFELIDHGCYSIQQRTLLNVISQGDVMQGYPFALNEVAVMKRDNSSMITIYAYVDGEPLAVYQADGLIISTPTGSTGYNLSVGGPILHPRCESFCVTPISPHSLNFRPITLCDNVTVELVINSRNHHYLLSLDGRSEVMNDATRLLLKKANYTIGVVRLHGHSFFDTLRKKMMWGADLRAE